MLFQGEILFPEYGYERIVKRVGSEHLGKKGWLIDTSMMSLKHEFLDFLRFLSNRSGAVNI